MTSFELLIVEIPKRRNWKIYIHKKNFSII